VIPSSMIRSTRRGMAKSMTTTAVSSARAASERRQ
jgi:hypothetical protein